MKEKPLPESYFELVRKFPLRFILTAQQAREGRKVLHSIIARYTPHELDEGQRAYIECLAALLDFYESL